MRHLTVDIIYFLRIVVDRKAERVPQVVTAREETIRREITVTTSNFNSEIMIFNCQSSA